MDALAIADARHGPVSVERVTTLDALQALAPEWEALWSLVPDRTPFQHPAWLIPWWRTFGRGELRVVIVRAHARAIGLVPFYLSQHAELRLLGAGLSDYLDALAAPGAERIVAAAISRELQDSSADWTFCGLDNIRDGSLLLQIDPPPRMHETMTSAAPCPVLTLPSNAAALPQCMSRKLVCQIRYSRRRAARLGSLEIVPMRGDDVREALNMLFTLHGRRWAARGQPGVLSDDKVRAFHCDAAPRLHGAGLLRLFSVRVGTRIAAVHYGLHACDCAFFYLGGFDPEVAALSVGSLAIAGAIETAIAEGATIFDFLGGQEAYKYRWGAQDRPRWCRHFTR